MFVDFLQIDVKPIVDIKYDYAVIVCAFIMICLPVYNKFKAARRISKSDVLSIMIGATIMFFSIKKSNDDEDFLREHFGYIFKKNDSLSKQIFINDSISNSKIDSLQTDNYNLSRALTNSTIALTQNILGAEYLYFYVTRSGDNFIGNVLNTSDHPAYDLVLLGIDPTKVKQCKIGRLGKVDIVDKICFDKSFISETRSDILPANNHSEINYSIPIDTAIHKIEMLLYTRSAYYVQRTIFKFQNGKCIQSSMSYRMVKDKPTVISTRDELRVNPKEWEIFLTPGYISK